MNWMSFAVLESDMIRTHELNITYSDALRQLHLLCWHHVDIETIQAGETKLHDRAE
jgi:hypothetical protein